MSSARKAAKQTVPSGAALMIPLFEKDLLKLEEEITLFKAEATLWRTSGAITNTAGNLALHLAGNLKHFIGAVLGDTGYIRQRDLEFSRKNVTRKELLQEISEARIIVGNVLKTLTDAQLKEQYPIDFTGRKVLISELLFILYGHLNYHLGQINYLRRILNY